MIRPAICAFPSYRQQVVTLTYPHIGNVGANEEDQESGKAQIAGLIIRERPRISELFGDQGGY